MKTTKSLLFSKLFNKKQLFTIVAGMSSMFALAQQDLRVGTNVFTIENETKAILKSNGNVTKESNGLLLSFPGEGSYAGNFVMPKQVKVKDKNIPVKALYETAFENCPKLESITIEDSVLLRDSRLFITGCKNLKQIRMKAKAAFRPSENYHVYDIISMNGMVTAYDKEADRPIEYDRPLDGILQQSVRYLVYNDMAYVVGVDTTADLSKVTIKNAINYNGKSYPVKAVMAYAFQHTKIQEINLPQSIEYIGNHAFLNCRKLRTLNLFSNTQLEYIGIGAFEGCASLKSAVLPSKITNIPDECFANCQALEIVIIPKSLKTMGWGWHENCPNLKLIDNLHTISSVDEPPQNDKWETHFSKSETGYYFHSEVPPYPKWALEQGIQGSMALTFIVYKDGSISEISVLKSTNAQLTNYVIEEIKKAKWQPAKIEGNPVSCVLNYPNLFYRTEH